MADRKISELTNITGADIADGDEFVVVDASASETKAIVFSQLKEAVGIGDFTVTGTLTSDGLTVNGDVTATGGDLNLDTLDLNALAATISDTAVDVFVYDTSKDSDGGAWRKRTQGTSWYNETLNTATRGSRKEFPSVAVIVAESNQVTIYDGDDPDLPMWMVFNQGSGQHLGSTSLTLTALVATNGGIYVTYTSGSYGYHQLNFLKDASFFHNSNGVAVRSLPILNRNEQNSSTVINTNGVLNAAHNDVAMTVLPNAPIDAATGLPVPTIYVVTEGGASIINNDGTVADITGYYPINKVAISGDSLILDHGNVPGYAVLGSKYVPSDVSFSVWSYRGQQGLSPEYYTTNTVPALMYRNLDTAQTASNDSLVYLGGSSGLNVLDEEINSSEKSLVAYTTSDYNTGWMNGDIKLATLSDTDDTDVTGSELVTNGDGSSASGWALFGGATGVTVSNGALVVTQGTTNYGGVYQAISVTSGKTYTISIEGSSEGDYSGWLQVGDNAGGSQYVNAPTIAAGSSYGYTFVPTQSTIYVNLRVGVSVDNVSSAFDNISVRLAEEDRSVNGNGLQVFGTVTKNPVATGADLVAYSGFSGNNYLEQPYNSDLDFGTGDFCVMGWINIASTSQSNSFVSRGASLTTTPWFETYVNTSSKLSFGYRTANSVQAGFSSDVSVAVGTWSQLVIVKVGLVVSLYINGVFDKSQTIDGGSLSNTNAYTRVGFAWTGGYGRADTKIALTRISATAPSPEQIAKIYRDEAPLFQENAQATLYGSSDAVTALAYDDSTEILSVGTSAGRSDFQGLRRVNNTTTGVTTSISASNGLIVEQ